MDITLELLQEIQQKIKERLNVTNVSVFLKVVPKPYGDVILSTSISFDNSCRALEYMWTISNMPYTTTEQLRVEYPIQALKFFTLALSKH